MGTRDTYIQAQKDAMDGKVVLKNSFSRNPEGPLVVPPSHIGKNCEISQNAQVGPYTVIGDGCRIRPGAIVENSILWSDVTIGNDTTIKNCIISSGTYIDAGKSLTDLSFSP